MVKPHFQTLQGSLLFCLFLDSAAGGSCGDTWNSLMGTNSNGTLLSLSGGTRVTQRILKHSLHSDVKCRETPSSDASGGPEATLRGVDPTQYFHGCEARCVQDVQSCCLGL